MIEKWKEIKHQMFLTMLFFYWLQRITDIKWLIPCAFAYMLIFCVFHL